MSHYEQSNAETGRSDANNYILLPVVLHQITITVLCKGGVYDLQPNADGGLTEVQNSGGKVISQSDRVIREVWIHEHTCATLYILILNFLCRYMSGLQLIPRSTYRILQPTDARLLIKFPAFFSKASTSSRISKNPIVKIFLPPTLVLSSGLFPSDFLLKYERVFFIYSTRALSDRSDIIWQRETNSNRPTRRRLMSTCCGLSLFTII
jgi:hypothetical protein